MNYKKVVLQQRVFIMLMIAVSIAPLCAAGKPKPNRASDFRYDLNGKGDSVYISGYIGKSSEVVIPEEIEDFPVTAYYADEYHDSTTLLVFPDSVKHIVMQFPYYNAIKKIVLPKGLQSICDRMCSNCTDLTDIEFPHGLEEIGKQAFLDCRNLTNIKLPVTLRSIGMEGFSNSGLTTVLLPASLKKIGEGTFKECEQLETLVIENGVTVIGKEAFARCSKLKTLILPASVKRIEEDAFRDCSGLESIVIGNGIEYIGVHAFAGCGNVTNLTIPEKRITYERREGYWSVPGPDGYFHDVCGTYNSSFGGCTSLPLKIRKAVKATGYTDSFEYDEFFTGH